MTTSTRGFAELTGVTLTDEDSNSILTNRAIPRKAMAKFGTDASGALGTALWLNFQIMNVAPSSDLIFIKVVGKFAMNASGAIWWPNLELMQVVPSGGQICY